MSKIFVIGNGGHSKVVIDCLRNNNIEIMCFLDFKAINFNSGH